MGAVEPRVEIALAGARAISSVAICHPPAGRGLVGDSKLCAGINIDQVNATPHRGCELIDDRQADSGADRFPRQLGF